jgi:hypothetical protein
MRKLAAVAVAAMLFALSGCAGGGGYIETIREDRPTLTEDLTEEELESIGEAVCAALDEGLSGHRAAAELEASGMSIADAGTVVLAASDHLCPQHASTVD